MAGWSQSHFLQALGWATLSSFWQMALLWCAFASVNHLFAVSATRKYQASVAALLAGFGWFIATFFSYYRDGAGTYAFFETTIGHTGSLLHILLLSASLTYLLLLFFPAARLFKNWQFVQRIKTESLGKADMECRMFVQKIAGQLGISKKVKLVVSNLISSPVTIGYLKPMILLPVAALNQLSTTQVEAILLHELSHIRRYDYVINLVVSFIQTLLYFNPFVRLFMNSVEAERENCCDELVLQFGYDKIGYASALLHLEKASGRHGTLTLAAAGKQNLLTRIEKIVGMEKKRTFKLVQIVPLFAALVCVLLFNSVLIIKDAKNGPAISYTNAGAFMPWQLNDSKKSTPVAPLITTPATPSTHETASTGLLKIDIINMPLSAETSATPGMPLALVEHIIPVDFNEVDGRLTTEEKNDVKNIVSGTKKVVSELHWKDIETSMADVLDKKEKALVKKEYFNEVEKVNWNTIEQNMKANYDRLDLETIHASINAAMNSVKLDSLQTLYTLAMEELQKTQKELKVKARVKLSPIPDGSLEQINIAKQSLQQTIDSIKSSRPKKIIRL